MEVERVARGGLTADDSGVIVTLTEHGEDGIGLGARKVRQRNGLAGVDDPVAVGVEDELEVGVSRESGQDGSDTDSE